MCALSDERIRRFFKGLIFDDDYDDDNYDEDEDNEEGEILTESQYSAAKRLTAALKILRTYSGNVLCGEILIKV